MPIRPATLTLLAALLFATVANGKRPPGAQPPWRVRSIVMRTDPCLAHIVDREDRTWNPTAVGLGGSYGLPQASPPKKMAAAGPDWRTNPWTQLRWARMYAARRYGGTCAAWRFWQRNRWW